VEALCFCFLLLLFCVLLLGFSGEVLASSFILPSLFSTPLFPAWPMLSSPFAPSSRLLLYLSFDPVLGSPPLPPWLLPTVRATPSHLTPATQVMSDLDLHLPRTNRPTHLRLCICCVSMYAALPHAYFVARASHLFVSFMMVEHACWRLIPPLARVLCMCSSFLLDDRWCWLARGMISCWCRLLTPRT